MKAASEINQNENVSCCICYYDCYKYEIIENEY